MSNLINKLYAKSLMAKENVKKLWKEERGEANIIALILILVIVIGLVILFKDAISSLVGDIIGKFTGQAQEVLK